ncbi:MAG TPA: hypothetical protein VI756_01380, partial [Blastocatellia bacterium]
MTLLAKMLGGSLHGTSDFLRWYVEHPEGLRRTGRVVMLLAGGATIGVTMHGAYCSSRSRHSARIAGLVLLGMPLFHHASLFIKEDIWAALFGAAALTLALTRKNALWVGGLLGVAIAAKYTAVGLLPGLALLVAANSCADGISLRALALSCTRLALAAGVAFALLNPYFLIHLKAAIQQIQIINSEYMRGQQLGAGITPPLLAGSVIGEFIPFDIGIAAILAVVAGLAQRNRLPRASWWALMMGPLTVIVLVGACRAGFPRSLTVVLPWIAVLAGLTWPRLTGRPILVRALPAVLFILLGVFQVSSLYRYMAAPDTRELAANFVEQNIPSDSVVLCEGLHDQVPDEGITLRPNLRSLIESQNVVAARRGSGMLSQIEREVAASGGLARFDILGEKDFGIGGSEELKRADVVVTATWLSPFPDAREYNLSGASTLPAVADYDRRRALFFQALDGQGFRLARTFKPSLASRWSFIDRPDPKVLYVDQWLSKQNPLPAQPEAKTAAS